MGYPVDLTRVARQQDVVDVPRAVRVDNEIPNLCLLVYPDVVRRYPGLQEYARLVSALRLEVREGLQVLVPGIGRNDYVLVAVGGLERPVEGAGPAEVRVGRASRGIVRQSRDPRHGTVVVPQHRTGGSHRVLGGRGVDLDDHARVVRELAGRRVVLDREDRDAGEAVSTEVAEHQVAVLALGIDAKAFVVRFDALNSSGVRQRVLPLPRLHQVAVPQDDPVAEQHPHSGRHLAGRQQ